MKDVEVPNSFYFSGVTGFSKKSYVFHICIAYWQVKVPGWVEI